MFQDLGENRFSVCFNHHLDREHALEGSSWLLDRCALLLLPLEDNMDPKTVEINMMKIVVCLHNVPYHLRSGRVVEQIGESLGKYIERVNMKREEYMDFIRVLVLVDVTMELKQGTYLRMGDGSKKWVAFTYERMPLYCYL